MQNPMLIKKRTDDIQYICNQLITIIEQQNDNKIELKKLLSYRILMMLKNKGDLSEDTKKTYCKYHKGLNAILVRISPDLFYFVEYIIRFFRIHFAIKYMK
jgi:hypothetical protein